MPARQWCKRPDESGRGSLRGCATLTNTPDLIVEDLVIVEIKVVENLLPLHKAQLRTYLRLSGKRLGLLINFDVALIRDGIKRVVNGLRD